jgi:hypothetical protein
MAVIYKEVGGRGKQYEVHHVASHLTNIPNLI